MFLIFFKIKGTMEPVHHNFTLHKTPSLLWSRSSSAPMAKLFMQRYHKRILCLFGASMLHKWSQPSCPWDEEAIPKPALRFHGSTLNEQKKNTVLCPVPGPAVIITTITYTIAQDIFDTKINTDTQVHLLFPKRSSPPQTALRSNEYLSVPFVRVALGTHGSEQIKVEVPLLILHTCPFFAHRKYYTKWKKHSWGS